MDVQNSRTERKERAGSSRISEFGFAIRDRRLADICMLACMRKGVTSRSLLSVYRVLNLNIQTVEKFL